MGILPHPHASSADWAIGPGKRRRRSRVREAPESPLVHPGRYTSRICLPTVHPGMPPYRTCTVVYLSFRLSGASLGCPNAAFLLSGAGKRDLPRDPSLGLSGPLKEALRTVKEALRTVKRSRNEQKRAETDEKSRNRRKGTSLREVLGGGRKPSRACARARDRHPGPDARRCYNCPRRPEAPSPCRSEAASRSACRPSSRG